MTVKDLKMVLKNLDDTVQIVGFDIDNEKEIEFLKVEVGTKVRLIVRDESYWFGLVLEEDGQVSMDRGSFDEDEAMKMLEHYVEVLGMFDAHLDVIDMKKMQLVDTIYLRDENGDVL